MSARYISALMLLACAPAIASAQRSAIERASWLAGCWELRSSNRVTMEMWMPPAAGVMLGASRTVVGNVEREFEFLRLASRGGDTLVYTAIPSGQRAAEFTSADSGKSPIVFENLAHDFPQRIIYRQLGTDSLVARIEGPGPGETTRGVDFPMRRVECARTQGLTARPG